MYAIRQYISILAKTLLRLALGLRCILRQSSC
jgi:hypothetical protein